MIVLKVKKLIKVYFLFVTAFSVCFIFPPDKDYTACDKDALTNQ